MGTTPWSCSCTHGAHHQQQIIQAAQQLLLDFDLCSKYGPMSGLTRMQRWERAAAAALDPPEAVKEVLLQHGLESAYNQPRLMSGKRM